MASCAPTVPCPFCESRGSRGTLGFFNKPCGLCEGRAFLFEAPHKCVACSGRGRRRERGHILESECSICSGTGFTLRKLQPCELCCRKSSLVQLLKTAPECVMCGSTGWVDGHQSPCIICEGSGRLGVSMGQRVAQSTGANIGKVALTAMAAGGLIAGPLGAAGGLCLAMYAPTKSCHGCKGATMRTGAQLSCPRCKTSGTCNRATGNG